MTLQSLISIGDGLYGIDAVRERNDAGMNKIDHRIWPVISASGNIGRIATLLKKYRRQIGEESFAVVLANLPKVRLFVSAGGEISAEGYLGKDLFSKYLSLVKAAGCRYNPVNRSWGVCGGFDLAAFIEAANKEGLEVDVDPAFGNNQEEAQKKVEAIAQSREKSQKTVFVTVRTGEGGRVVAFRCGGFSSEFNEIFSNRSGVLSGITEYNPNDHARLTKSVRLAQEAIEKIKEKMPEFGIDLASEFLALVAEQDAKDEADKTAIPAVADKLAPEFTLFAHQNRAIKFLDETNGNALIGACMGSGKTAITLAWAAANGKRVAVVCPKVVRRTWCQEAAKFFPTVFAGKCLELKGRVAGGADLSGYQLVSVNYEGLDKFGPAIAAGKFDVLVIDESHSIKNGKSKRAKACADLALTIPHHILLSGTAIKNSRDELFPQLQIVAPTLYPSVRAILGDTIGAFWHKISSCYLSMAKADILKFLPPKIIQKCEEGVAAPVDIPHAIEEVSRAKVECALSKIDITKEYLENFLENSTGKALVFSDSMEVVTALFEHFGNEVAILHHGQMSDDRRETAKATFQEEGGEHRLFISTRQSLAVGATLTAADTVVFNDLPWTTADIQQAEDRAHRIGQLKSVNVIWMVAENSEFDSHLCAILYKKYLICKAVNEGKQITEEERRYMETAVSFADLIAANIAKKAAGKKA